MSRTAPALRQSANLSDTLPNEALQSFFEVKEKFFYFKGFRNAGRRKDFTPEFIETCATFVRLHRQYVGRLYDSHVRPKAGSKAKATQKRLHPWPRFDEFFAAADLKDLAAAKTAYRRAALTLHPDLGGATEDMALLNDAFATVLDHFIEQDVADELGGGASQRIQSKNESSFACGPAGAGFWPGAVLQYPQSSDEFVVLIASECLLAAEDLLEEDKWCDLAIALEPNPRWEVSDRDDEAFFKAGACQKIAGLLIDCREAALELENEQLAMALAPLAATWTTAAIHGWMREGARDVPAARQAERQEAALREGRIPFVSNEWRANSLRELMSRNETSGCGRSRKKFMLTHPRKAENALRRKLITQKRYEDAIARLGAQQNAAFASASALEALQFMRLELDPPQVDEPVTATLIPDAPVDSAFGNWVLHSPESARDYNRAFYGSGGAQGKLKYIRQRLWLTLSSLIAYADNWGEQRLSCLSRELDALIEAAGAAKEGGSPGHAKDLLDFAQFLLSEDAARRRRRLKLLEQLRSQDIRDFAPAELKDTAIASGRLGGTNPLSTVIPSPDYYRIATKPLEELELIGAGKWEDKERADDQAGLEYYYDHLHRHCERMSKAADLPDPEARAARLEPLVRQAIDMDAPLHAVPHWQIDYYIDRLSSAWSRLGEHSKAADLLKEFFDLPAPYRRGCTASVERQLRNRLESMIKRGAASKLGKH